jgi:hypothetical protein
MLEALRDQRVERGAHGAMVLDDTRRQPFRDTPAFALVAVDRPALAAFRIHDPAWTSRRHVDGMLGRKDEIAAIDQDRADGLQQAREIRDVMQRQRTVGEIE